MTLIILQKAVYKSRKDLKLIFERSSQKFFWRVLLM